MHYAVAVLTLGVAFSATCLVAVISVQLSGQDIHCNDQGAVPKFNCRRMSQFQCEKRLNLSKSGGLVPGLVGWSLTTDFRQIFDSGQPIFDRFSTVSDTFLTRRRQGNAELCWTLSARRCLLHAARACRVPLGQTDSVNCAPLERSGHVASDTLCELEPRAPF